MFQNAAIVVWKIRRKEMQIEFEPRGRRKTHAPGYESLAKGIVYNAIYDYIKYEELRTDVELFIKSDWFMELSDLNSVLLLNLLKEKVS